MVAAGFPAVATRVSLEIQRRLRTPLHRGNVDAMRRLLPIVILLLAVAVAAPAAFATRAIATVTVGAQTPSSVNAGGTADFAAFATTWTGSFGTCTPVVTFAFTGGTPAGVTESFASTITNSNPSPDLYMATTGATPAGSYAFTVTVASTGGSGSCSTGSANGSGTLVVAGSSIATTSTVSSSVNPSVTGQSVTFTSTIAPASGSTVPTGTVQFQIDSVNFGGAVAVTGCSPAPDACASSTADSALAQGNHTVTATFTPTTAVGSGTVTQTFSTGPNVNDTITIGGVTYTWKTTINAVNQVFASATEAGAAADLRAAIMGNSGLCSDTNCINGSQTANPNAVATSSGAVTTITNKSAATLALSATFASGATYTLSPTSGGIPVGFVISSDTLDGGQVVNPATNPVPAITTLSPASAIVGAGAQTLTINGSNFVATSTATYNGVAHTVTFVNAGQVTIPLTAGDQATTGSFPVIVTNPAPGGGTSNTVNFAVNNPVPTISTIAPTSANAGAAAQTLTINGTNFLASSTATYNGVAHAVTFVTSIKVTILLTTGDQATAGTFPVVATNPAPGGGASNSVNFTVNNLVPTITTLSPSSTTAGTGAQTLTINGSNFLATSTATYNGVAHTVSFVSAAQVTIPLTAGDQATGGTFAVVVTNPAPGGGASNSVNFTVNNLVPTITTLSPSSATAGASAQTLTINGTNFVATTTATYNGVGHTVTFVNSSQVTIPLTAPDQATAGNFPVVVTNPAPGGGASNAVNFTITNGAPTITTLAPSSVTAGASAQTLTINGTNFVATSTATYNGVAHTVTFVNSGQVTIPLTAPDQATAGTFPVIVTNPAPGGGTSNTVNFTVNNSVPTITTISPTSATAGAAAQTLTINGTNFLTTSTATYGGLAHAVTFVTSIKVTILLTTGDQATAGTFPVVVTNPAPGGGASNSVNFTVNNPVPTITMLSPPSATTGTGAQTLTINGTNFLATSTATYNGVAHTVTFVSAAQVTIPLTAGDQATAGNFAVVVTNPTPGGGASNSVSFTVNNLVPTITTLSPSSATAGAGAQTLTINGTNFVTTSTATYNGVAHTVTFVNAGQVTIPLTAADQATGGNFAVVVTNPAPGGGASNSVNFTVNNGAPTITTLSPSSATAGASAQTLTINGTNFVTTSTATYNGVAHTVTFVNSGAVTIPLTVADQATTGTFPVIVTNPAPGGGTSNTVNFTVNNAVPTLTTLSPTSATAGAGAQTLTINGTKFLTISTATYNGVAHTVTFVSATQVTIPLTAGDQATAGSFPVVVTNPAPGGGNSNTVNFTVNNPVPTITSLSPTGAAPGSAAQTLTINGTNFLATSTVKYNSVAHTATFVNSGQLTIQLTAGDQATTGNFPVVVTNPAPGGGASNSVNFVVATASINAVTVGSQTPNPVPQGSSATFPITTGWAGTGLDCVSNPPMVIWTAQPAGTTASFSPATVSSGSTSTTLTISTTASTPPGTTTFTVSVSNNAGGGCTNSNNVNSTTLTPLVISGNAAPTITKAFSPTTIAPNATSTLTLVISASAFDLGSLTNVSVSDPFPAGMQVASTPGTTNACTGGSTAGTFSPSPSAGDTTINYSGATLIAGGSCTLTLSVTAATPGTYVNTTGNVTAGNVSVAGNTASASLIVFGAPAQLAFLTQPSNATANTAIAPAVTVQIEDANGILVGNSSSSVTVAVGTNPGLGILNGTTTVNAVSGVATFSTLSINRAGVGYTLTAASVGLTGATSSAFNIAGQTTTGTYTQPFNQSPIPHGWTYTQLTCVNPGLGATCSNNANVTVAADCQSQPCVSATFTTNGLATAATMTGYFHNPAGYTWQTIGVPAGATVISVQGAWWDFITQSGAGCDNSTDTTVGIHIYNSANNAEITSAPVFADTGVDGDTAAAGVTHTAASAVTVNAGFTASSTAITLRFDINPSAAANAFNTPTCNIFGDNFNLIITYTKPNSNGRRGQVIIGFMRMPDGDFMMTKNPVLVSSKLDGAAGRASFASPAILPKREE